MRWIGGAARASPSGLRETAYLLYRLDGIVNYATPEVILSIAPSFGPDPETPSLPHRPNARERILAAAAELAREEGPANLALDAVAQRAGVSKGGLLYHFPSKDGLLQALVAAHLQAFESELEAEEARCGAEPPSFPRAYLKASLKANGEKLPSAGVAAAMVQNPQTTEQLRAFRRRMLDRLRAGARSQRQALLLFLVLDGLCSMQLFDLGVFTRDELAVAEQSIADMLDEWA